MKFKVVCTLLFLAGSAFSQLIPIREESGFMNSYGVASPLTFTLTYDGPVIAYETRGHVPTSPTSLSLRDSFSATPTFAENPNFGASLHDVRLHRFSADSVPAAAETSAPTALDLAASTAAARTPSDTFPINPDHDVLVLMAEATLP